MSSFRQMQDQQTFTQLGAARLVVNVTGQLERSLKMTPGALTYRERLLAPVHLAEARDSQLPPAQGDLEVVLGDAGQIDDQPVRLTEVEQVELKLEASRRNAVRKFADPVAQDEQALQVALGALWGTLGAVVAFIQLHRASLARTPFLSCGVCTSGGGHG